METLEIKTPDSPMQMDIKPRLARLPNGSVVRVQPIHHIVIDLKKGTIKDEGHLLARRLIAVTF